jgi:quinol monooxygenase YgiN
MIMVRFKMPLNPKNRNELINAIKSISQEVRQEEGCLDTIIFQNIEDENELIMLEAWKSKTLLKKHWKTLNFSALLGTQNLLSCPLQVEINNVSETIGLEEIEKYRAVKRANNSGKGLKVNKNLDVISSR